MARIEETPEAKRARRTRQQAAYNQRATRQVLVRLNKNTDADVIAWLERQESMQGRVKELIRAEIAREAGGE